MPPPLPSYQSSHTHLSFNTSSQAHTYDPTPIPKPPRLIIPSNNMRSSSSLLLSLLTTLIIQLLAQHTSFVIINIVLVLKKSSSCHAFTFFSPPGHHHHTTGSPFIFGSSKITTTLSLSHEATTTADQQKEPTKTTTNNNVVTTTPNDKRTQQHLKQQKRGGQTNNHHNATTKNSTIKKQKRSNNNKKTKPKSKRRPSPNRKTSILWVIQSLEKMVDDDDSGVDEELIFILYDLHRARTSRDIIITSQTLSTYLSNHSPQTPSLSSRLLKITSLCGLLPLSATILSSHLQKFNSLPNVISFSEYLSLLRGRRKLTAMKKVLEDCMKYGIIDAVSFNIYLGACLDKDYNNSNNNNNNSNNIASSAVNMMLNDVKTRQTYHIDESWPDTFAYNMVLNKLSRQSHSRELMNTLLAHMTHRNITKDGYTYNSLLRSLSHHNNITNDDGGDAILFILDEMTLNKIPIDSYTIDLSLLPLLKSNRIGRIVRLFTQLMTSAESSKTIIQKTFESCFARLAKEGEVETSVVLLKQFLLTRNDDETTMTTLPPSTRCFNCIFDGYRKLIVSNTGGGDVSQRTMELFTMMKENGIPPDDYTVTILLDTLSRRRRTDDYDDDDDGVIARCRDDFHDILRYYHTVNPYIYNWSNVVARAVMKACGTCAMPTEAVRVLEMMRVPEVDTWNALLGVLAKHPNVVLSFDENDEENGVVLPYFKNDLKNDDDDDKNSNNNERRLIELSPLLQNITACQSSLIILNQMKMTGMTSNDATSTRTRKMMVKPTFQSYCLVATAIAASDYYNELDDDVVVALLYQLYDNATASSDDGNVMSTNSNSNSSSSSHNKDKNHQQSVKNDNDIIIPDGRFLNAFLRCFQSNINDALAFWKSRILTSPLVVVVVENKKNNNFRHEELRMAYHGLLYVCGRSHRPDIALRLIYAMRRMGLGDLVDENEWRCYESGKTRTKTMRWLMMAKKKKKKMMDEIREEDEQLRQESKAADDKGGGVSMMMKGYEDILMVECCRYDVKDKRREGERRVRIIL